LLQISPPRLLFRPSRRHRVLGLGLRTLDELHATITQTFLNLRHRGVCIWVLVVVPTVPRIPQEMPLHLDAISASQVLKRIVITGRWQKCHY
jgi:hypothetical protein